MHCRIWDSWVKAYFFKVSITKVGLDQLFLNIVFTESELGGNRFSYFIFVGTKGIRRKRKKRARLCLEMKKISFNGQPRNKVNGIISRAGSMLDLHLKLLLIWDQKKERKKERVKRQRNKKGQRNEAKFLIKIKNERKRQETAWKLKKAPK